MITPKARSLAVDLQAALTGNDGLNIHRGMLALIEEMGGSREVAGKLVTPIAQCVYMMVLLIQRTNNPPPFKIVQGGETSKLGNSFDDEPTPGT